MNNTFEETKEGIYSKFEERAGQLLDEFVKEKREAACLLCSGSCTEGEKTHRALQILVEFMVMKAAEGCDNREDIWMCTLCPYFSTLDLLKRHTRGKYAKLLVEELEGDRERLLAILRKD